MMGEGGESASGLRHASRDCADFVVWPSFPRKPAEGASVASKAWIMQDQYAQLMSVILEIAPSRNSNSERPDRFRTWPFFRPFGRSPATTA